MTTEQNRQRSDILNTQVVTIDTAKRLGVVKELLVDIDRREVVALGLRDNLLALAGMPRYMLLSSIRRVGDTILVDDEDVIEDVEVEAYSTLITGFFLLCLVYYYGAEVALIDPSVMPLTKPEAIAIGLGFLVLGWLVYDWLCRSAFGEDDAILGGLLMLYCAVSAWALCHLFSGRGAYIHFGAMLGTIMVLNVYYVIIPGQRELVKAKEEGRTPDPKYGLMGRQRSVHNTYFTLPVLFTMISGHYAGLYGHEWNWVLLLLISVAGALVRVWFVQRHKGNQNPLVLAAGLVVLAITALVSLPRPQADIGPPASFAEVQPIFKERCQSCHAAKPTQEGFAAPPKGVILETPEELRARAAIINQQVWVTRVMPPGNMTHMTDAERRLIARWFKGGAE